MQNVEILVGSPRKRGNSFLMSKMLIDSLKNDKYYSNISFLYDYEIKPCVDCRACKKDEMVCILEDDMNNLYTRIEKADIMEYIAETLRGVTDIDTAAIAAVNTAAPYEVGYYTGDSNPNTLEVMTELAKTFFGYYGFNRAGEFDVGVFGAPAASASLSLDESDIDLGSMKRQVLGEVTHKVVVNARPNFVTQDKDSLASGVSQADKALYGKEYQVTVTAEDATVLTKYPEARELIVDTVIYV